MSGRITVEQSLGRATVTIDHREHKNSMTPGMWGQLLEILRSIADDRGNRVVVLTGAGIDFCSGADLSEFGGEGPFIREMDVVSHTCQALHDLPQPTIARVRGVAAGAGANLALGCDLVIAADDARFSQIFSRVGLSVDAGGSWLLPRLVGVRRAKELALLAGMVAADHACEIGLINRVVTVSDLDNAVEEWAEQLALGPPIALASTKRLIDQGGQVDFGSALAAEAAAQAVNVVTDDAGEALRAYHERRPPNFTGH